MKIVQWAIKTLAPFVVKSGDCSAWSTIGDNGIMIDLLHYSSISVGSKSANFKTTGGVTEKGLATELAEQGQFTGKIHTAAYDLNRRRLTRYLAKSPWQWRSSWSQWIHSWQRLVNHELHHGLWLGPGPVCPPD